MIATTTDGQNDKIGAQNIYIAISDCWSLLQSFEVSFFELTVVENPRFAVGILTISVTLSEIWVPLFWLAILLFLVIYFWYLFVDTFCELAMVKNFAFATRIRIIPDLSSWQNWKAWDSFLHLPFTPTPLLLSISILFFLPSSFLCAQFFHIFFVFSFSAEKCPLKSS